jgi:hypothetical protein
LLSRGRTPRLLLRIKRGLQRRGRAAADAGTATPPDRAWHEMLMRLEAEEAERRLDAMAAALDERARR